MSSLSPIHVPGVPLVRQLSLQAFNTFGIDVAAETYVKIDRLDVLQQLITHPDFLAWPRLVLGGGSNVLLTRDVPGLTLHMALRGIHASRSTGDIVEVTAAAGENWHELVQWTITQGMGGLENLALIPGTVGAAPIQNIGAYGLEVAQRIVRARVIDVRTGQIRILDNAQCRFGYRDSVFKQNPDQWIVLDVTFALPLQWRAELNYKELAAEVALHHASTTSITPADVAAAVCTIRRRKLPDPAQIGNAGSFFKNPVVPQPIWTALSARYPGLVAYLQSDGQYKLAAGWMIDQCGWKGKTLGAAGVHDKQALVLVNRGGASGHDVVQLAKAIQVDVQQRFGVLLEPEPVWV